MKNFQILTKKISSSYILTLLLLPSLLIISCGKLFVEPDPVGSAEQNFEIFWSDINNTYPYFGKDQVDWNEVYKNNRGKVTSATSNAQLFVILKNMLGLLSDAHQSITFGDSVYFGNRTLYFHNYDSSNVFKTYLHNKPKYAFAPDEQKPGKSIVVSDYGITDDSIIYYHLRTYLTIFSIENNFNNYSRQHPGAKGLILDLRDNGGGNISTMIKFMGIFFERPIDYMILKQKTGPLPNNFARPENFTIRPANGLPIFTKPIVVLTNRNSASASEHTVMAMKLRSKTTIVGDTTYGAFSFVLQRTLPNGMQFSCVSNQITDVNGNNYEGSGIPPDKVSFLTSEFFLQKKDNLIEDALTILKK